MFDISNSILTKDQPFAFSSNQSHPSTSILEEKLSNMAKVIVVLVETALIESALAQSLNDKINGSEPSI